MCSSNSNRAVLTAHLSEGANSAAQAGPHGWISGEGRSGKGRIRNVGEEKEEKGRGGKRTGTKGRRRSKKGKERKGRNFVQL